MLCLMKPSNIAFILLQLYLLIDKLPVSPDFSHVDYWNRKNARQFQQFIGIKYAGFFYSV
jgi:hypothetical protein